MLLIRYFVFTGCMLLGLLLLADRYFHLAAAVAADDHIDRSIIRIHSNQQWPAAIRFDTSAPVPAASAETAPLPAVPDSAKQAYALQPPPLQKTHETIRRNAKPSRLTSRASKQRVANYERPDTRIWQQKVW
jgi:hypothetical protein